jgi:glutamate dehydrogenase/leucine dehydrogenase
MRIDELEPGGEHEALFMCVDEASGYRGVIAVHSTALGPAVGGTRFWNYAEERLRASRGGA